MGTMLNTDSEYELLPEVTQFISQDLKLFINGAWTHSAAPKAAESTQNIIDPSTQNTLCQTIKAQPEDVDKAVAAARGAFEDGRWRNMPAAQRGDILLKISQLIGEHARELAELETLNAGKLFTDSLHGEIPAAAAAFRYYAERVEKITSEAFTPSIAGAKLSGYIRKEPIGVVGLIVPWNGPLVMAAWKLAPALASGCACLLKPAELTPLTALRLGELMQEAGVPDGIVNIITGAGSKIGAHMAAHKDIDKIAFTGSTATGRSLLTAAQGNFKKLSLELGGKSPVIIFADADMEAAIEGAAQAIFANAGQVCVAGSRLLVQESAYQQVIDGVEAIANNMKHGSPFAPTTNIGPLISEAQRATVHKFVETAQTEGGRLLTGGGAFAGDGFFYKPTIFTDITPNMTLYREEVFGPVLSVSKFTDFDDALARANDNKYGLASSVWTQDETIAEAMAHNSRAGIVWVNCHGIPDITMPIGGYRQSGWGRELGAQGMDIYMEGKSIMTKH